MALVLALHVRQKSFRSVSFVSPFLSACSRLQVAGRVFVEIAIREVYDNLSTHDELRACLPCLRFQTSIFNNHQWRYEHSRILPKSLIADNKQVKLSSTGICKYTCLTLRVMEVYLKILLAVYVLSLGK